MADLTRIPLDPTAAQALDPFKDEGESQEQAPLRVPVSPDMVQALDPGATQRMSPELATELRGEAPAPAPGTPPANVDTTDDARAARSFGRSAYMSGGTEPPRYAGDPDRSTLREPPIESTENPGTTRQTGFYRSEITANDIGSSMWDGMTYELANQRYAELLENPNVGMTPQFAVFNDPEGGRTDIPDPVVPKFGSVVRAAGGAAINAVFGDDDDLGFLGDFKQNLDQSPATVGAAQNIAGGLRESVGDVARLGAAGIDMAFDTDLYEQTDELFPRYNADTLMDSLLVDGVPALLAGGAAFKALRTIPEASGWAAKTLNAAAAATRVVAAETAAVATMGSEDATLLLGEDPLFDMDSPWLQGVNLGEEGAEAEISHRANLITEAFALSSAGAAVISAAGGGVNFVGYSLSPLWTAFSKSGQESQLTNDLADMLTGIPATASPQERAEAIRKMVATINRAGSEEIAVLQNGAAEWATRQEDVVTTLLRDARREYKTVREAGGSRTELDAAMNRVVQLETMYSGFSGPTFRDFRTATRRPEMDLESGLSDYVEARGGREAVGDAADNLLATGTRQIDEAEADAFAAREAFDQQVMINENLLSNIPEVRRILERIGVDNPEADSLLQQLEGLSSSRVVGEGEALRARLRDTLRQGYQATRSEKNRLRDLIQGGEVDAQGLIDLSRTLDLPDDFVTQMREFTSSPITRDFISLMRREAVPSGNVDATGTPIMRAETDDEMAERVQGFLDDNGYDFGYFYREVRPELIRFKDRLFRNDSGNAAAKTRSIIDHIDGPMLQFAGLSDPAVARAATDFLDFYKTEFVPWRNGSMREFSDLWENTVGRSGNGVVFDAPTFNNDAVTFIDTVFSPSSGLPIRTGQVADANRVANFTNGIRVSQNPRQTVDYLYFRMIEDLAIDVATRGVDNVDVAAFNRRAGPYINAMDSFDPTKAAEAQQFMGTLAAGGLRVGDLEQMAEQTATRAREVRSEATSGVLRNFLRDNMTLEGTSNPIAAFRQTLTEKEAVANVRDLLEAANRIDNPVDREMTLEGIRGAYGEVVFEIVFGASREVGGVRPVSVNRVQRDAGTANQSLREAGAVLFADTPMVQQAIWTMIDDAASLRSALNAKDVAAFSPTKMLFQNNDAAVREVTNRGINVSVGPLNRTATRIRSAVNWFLSFAQSEAESERFVSRLVANPQEFEQAIARYVRDPADPRVRVDTARLLGGVGLQSPGLAVDETPEETDDLLMARP